MTRIAPKALDSELRDAWAAGREAGKKKNIVLQSAFTVLGIARRAYDQGNNW